MSPTATAAADPAAASPASPAPAAVAPQPAPTPAAAPAEPASQPAPAEPEAPATEAALELVVPEGANVDPQYLAVFSERAKEIGLEPEKAQQLLDAEIAHKAQMVTGWGAQIKADPEFAGDKLPAAVQHARLAVERIWGAPFLDVLNKSGLGNYPDFFKGLAKIGALMAEPGAPPQGAPARRPKSAAEVFYPGMTAKE